MRHVLPTIVTAVSLITTSAARAQTNTLPTPSATASRPGNGLLLPQIPLHDPWILAHEESKTYYLYTSAQPGLAGTNRAGTVAYKSKDLRLWNGPYVVFQVPNGAWADPREGAWAPEVHFYKGRYYLFTTLHNSARVIDKPPDAWRVTHMRGTVTAVADSPDGPFTLLQTNGPVPPADFMTLDGTFYVEDGVPWMVYAHEWIQMIDGMMEAVPMTPDLSAAAGAPIHLFKASDAPWLNAHRTPSKKENSYVTDGPELYRTKTGQLLMLWSSYDRGSYMETLARSKSGKLAGPWEQLEPLVGNDSGHGMLFHSFEGQLMMVLHQPFRRAHARLFDMEDTGDNLKIIRARHDLDGQTDK